MFGNCPGQSSRYLKATYNKCPHCGYEVEIFSNEVRVRCYRCGKHVYRKKIPSCIDWCPAAKDCVGYLKWKELKRGGRKGGRNEEKNR